MRYVEIKEAKRGSLDDAAKKRAVISALNKKREEDPLFDQVYKLVVGPALDARIETVLTQVGKNDPDVNASIVKMLIKTIPSLGSASDVKSFVQDWNEGKEFINIKNLIPAKGMDAPKLVSSIVANPMAEKLLADLRAFKGGKSDAGPYEVALAILSRNITFATEEGGGDLIINGQKIEIKSGGEGGGGGRIYPDGKKLNQKPIADALSGTMYQDAKSIPVLAASGRTAGGQDWPAFAKSNPEEFTGIAKSINQVWFGGARPEIEKSFGTEDFRLLWNRAMFNDYKTQAGHNGVLILGATQFQYITSGDQLLNSVPQSSKGMCFYRNSRQDRDLGIQVKLN